MLTCGIKLCFFSLCGIKAWEFLCVHTRRKWNWLHIFGVLTTSLYPVIFLFLPPFLLHSGPPLLLLNPLLLQLPLPLLQELLVVLPGSLLTCLPLGLLDSCGVMGTHTQTHAVCNGLMYMPPSEHASMTLNKLITTVMAQLQVMWPGFSSEHKANSSTSQLEPQLWPLHSLQTHRKHTNATKAHGSLRLTCITSLRSHTKHQPSLNCDYYATWILWLRQWLGLWPRLWPKCQRITSPQSPSKFITLVHVAKKTTISQRGKVNTPYRQQQLLQTHAQFQNKTLTILFLTLLPAFTGQPLSLINLVKE